MSKQGEKMAAMAAAAGVSGLTYNETLLAFCKANGATSDTINEAIIEYAQTVLSSSDGNINNLLATIASDAGVDGWGVVASPPEVGGGGGTAGTPIGLLLTLTYAA